MADLVANHQHSSRRTLLYVLVLSLAALAMARADGARAQTDLPGIAVSNWPRQTQWLPAPRDAELPGTELENRRIAGGTVHDCFHTQT